MIIMMDGRKEGKQEREGKQASEQSNRFLFIPALEIDR
jgi:hypothetical protein